MRIYKNVYDLVSEIYRDVWEMGLVAHPNTMQNKVVKGDDDFSTKELLNYGYCLLSLDKEDYLYLADPRMKEYVRTELADRTADRASNPGNSWKIREDVWSKFLVEDGRFDYTYSERLIPYLRKVIIPELWNNPDSRQCVIPIFKAMDLNYISGKKRVPCSLNYQFLIREGKVHIIYTMRSCDVMTHFGVDVALAWLIKEFVKDELNTAAGDKIVESGYLFHNIASLHCYKKDWAKLKTCIENVRNKTL